jgi:hypothetical protein
MTIDWDAIYAAEAAKAMRTFRSAAKRVGKLLDQVAAGDKDLELKTISALNSLDSKALKPEIRGYAAAREEADNIISGLRRRFGPACEAGAAARQAARDVEIARLNEVIREQRANGFPRY